MNAAGNRFSQDAAEAESIDAIRQTLDLNLVGADGARPGRCSRTWSRSAEGPSCTCRRSAVASACPGIPQASYAASKMGLSGLTAELAVQWARHSIRVNTVAPGFFRSEITDELYDDERGQRVAPQAHTRSPSRAPSTTSSARCCGW